MELVPSGVGYFVARTRTCFFNPGSFPACRAAARSFRRHVPSSASLARKAQSGNARSGAVTRGFCRIDENGFLRSIVDRSIVDRRGIERINGVIPCTNESDPVERIPDPDTVVSMNFWGFRPAFLHDRSQEFPVELESILSTDPMNGECNLPKAVNTLLETKKTRGLPGPRVYYARRI